MRRRAGALAVHDLEGTHRVLAALRKRLARDGAPQARNGHADPRRRAVAPA
ncbi:MAG: hypothetical protein M5U07_01255 [Xanthobacteraceae bacterium]|nr:hypothetical protein [Xanthobacteraceae bacterium]